MSALIQPSEWLQFTGKEYLASFIRDGGCAMKFAVPLEDKVHVGLVAGLSRMAKDMGYLVAGVDAGKTKVHLIDEVFFRVAAQVPWEELSRKVLAKLASEAGYAWPKDGPAPLYQRLATQNRIDSQMLLLDLKKAIGSQVFKPADLGRDFRVAMTHLCIAELVGDADSAATVKLLTDWLTGRNRSVSAIKQLQIFRKINRANARYLLESLTHWLRLADCPGLVILMETERMMLPRNPRDGSIHYSKAAVLDAYEVMRQFIDHADSMQGCLMVVIPGSAFLEDESRGISAYEALKFRVFDEVRDRSLVNPMASLARISENAGGE